MGSGEHTSQDCVLGKYLVVLILSAVDSFAFRAKELAATNYLVFMLIYCCKCVGVPLGSRAPNRSHRESSAGSLGVLVRRIHSNDIVRGYCF